MFGLLYDCFGCFGCWFDCFGCFLIALVALVAFLLRLWLSDCFICVMVALVASWLLLLLSDCSDCFSDCCGSVECVGRCLNWLLFVCLGCFAITLVVFDCFDGFLIALVAW